MNKSLNDVSTIYMSSRVGFFAILLSEMLSHDEIIAGLIVIQLFFGGTVFVYAVFKQQGEQSNPRRYTEAEQQKLITEL